LAAEGALNLLGRPELDPLVILIREAAQNSWDARVKETGPVDFSVDLRRAEPRARKALTEELFNELPPRGLGLNGGSLLELSDALQQDDLWLLTLTDTGTLGLGGPIRADTPAAKGIPTDFVDLVFNIGQPPDRKFGGGTYGFGKTISYLVSQCRTVIIHTVTLHRGRLEHRLIAQAVGHQYAYRSRNFTGRHWWGPVKPHGVEPLTGRSAARLASALGLPDIEAEGGGTTLVVLAPDFTGRQPQQAATFMANALTWNFWPKMVAESRGLATMTFSVVCEGQSVDVIAPEDSPPLNGFAEALRAVRECEAGQKKPSDFPTFQIFEIRSQRPSASLGWLALHPVAVRDRRSLDEGVDDDGLPTTAVSFMEPAHHVALMRRAELVVQYQPGPGLSNPAVEWAGVFKASKLVDKAFAEAEPPTHDDWRPSLVADSRQRRYVNVALREIKSAVSSAFGMPVERDHAPQLSSGAVVADALGHLIATHPGTGASRRVDGSRGHGSPSRAVPKVTVLRRWFDHQNGAAMLNIEFAVTAAAGSGATLVEVVAAAATADGGFETDPPVGAAVPLVGGFSSGAANVDGPVIRVSAEDVMPLVVHIVQQEGIASAVDIRAVAEVGE
jgi:hypothetical protein